MLLNAFAHMRMCTCTHRHTCAPSLSLSFLRHTHTPSFHHPLIYSLSLLVKTVVLCMVTALFPAGPMRVTEPTQEGVSLRRGCSWVLVPCSWPGLLSLLSCFLSSGLVQYKILFQKN